MRAIRDILLTILSIFGIFFLLSLFTSLKPVTGINEGRIITLVPQEALLRGSLKISNDSGITNWRSNKNIVHWKIRCDQAGKYRVSLIHRKAEFDASLSLTVNGRIFNQTLEKFAQETRFGELDLTKGTHSIALYSGELERKFKLPTIYSIIFTKIN